MKVTILDAATLGDDITLDGFNQFDEVEVFKNTNNEDVKERIAYSDVVVLNKVKLNESNLKNCKNIKLICITATGFDNVDVDYCRKNNIAVCNVFGYSTDSVAQVTVATVLSLINHISEYDRYVKDSSYTKGGVHNHLKPVYHEMRGKTWGIIGYGNIGKQVGMVAKALGCNIIVYKKNREEGVNCVTLAELMKASDIITVHIPLNETTMNIIDKDMISLMKKDAVIVNMARGGVWDEGAIADAVIEEKIAAMGSDVYSKEPMGKNHPFSKLLDYDNVCLLPHMAWGSYESRVRCMDEVIKNINSFFKGEIRNRVDL